MQPFEAYPESAPRPPGSSTAQKALAVVAIMLGALGVMGGCCGAMSNMASSPMLEAQGQILGAEGMPNAEQQRAMVAALQEVTAKYGPFLVLVQLLNAVASTLLVVAGALMLSAHPQAALLTLIACGANVLIDLGIGTITVLQQVETARVTRGLMTDPQATPEMARAMETGFQAAMFGSLCFVGGWFFLKLAFYVANALVARQKPAY